MKTGNTKLRALVEARSLLQAFGFNGFSFQHLADALGIKKPSLYAHFESKEDLGKGLIEDYRLSFIAWSETVSVFEPEAQIGALFENFYKFSMDSKKLCPLSALIADVNSFPKGMKAALAKLYTARFAWLKTVIEKGQAQKVFRKDKSSGELANLVLAVGFGAQLTARVTDDPNQIKELKQQVLEILTLGQRK